MTTIKSALFVENALSDSSFSQHDIHAANADFNNSDHILVNSDLFTGQFGPHTIRSELTKSQIALRSELTNDQAAIRSELTKT